jgi:CheY-like chemotaxis protein
MDCTERTSRHAPLRNYCIPGASLAELNSRVLLNEHVNPQLGAEFRGAETILLVEDETFVRKVTCEVLTAAGYNVVTAENATEALAQREHVSQLDLLLTDVILPGRSGRALAGVLRSLQPDLVVLFVTGYPLQLAEISAAKPAEACLPKPFSAVTLLRKVREALNGKAEPGTGNLITRACETGSPS